MHNLTVPMGMVQLVGNPYGDVNNMGGVKWEYANCKILKQAGMT